ncbi:hypothetical protein SADUNF_Sadunf15G0078800 [Salix dunnii]|uniref:Uncharacterized protein n=1 Tax=Salix dunnii TaxID=1413687 RepID=A0A835JIW7_9ROSI|nr:hypothetical protein SADUNF_Sadunf15G0078800 [Salix dunnii]
MMDYHDLVAMSSCQDSLTVLEADIQHANVLSGLRLKFIQLAYQKDAFSSFAELTLFMLIVQLLYFLMKFGAVQGITELAASIPRAKCGSCLQMKLVYNPLTPIFLFLFRWMDGSCTCLLSTYLNLFHIAVYKVCSDRKQKISSCRRKASIRQFYGV